jgi:uncharacterized protein
MKNSLILLLFCALTVCCIGQQPTFSDVTESDIEYVSPNGIIYGSLMLPAVPSGKVPVVLIIAGSGPTDRNGNNPQMSNNSLKMLADSLARFGFACVRYDKRGIAQSQGSALKESDLRFEDYVTDASGWVSMLRSDSRFSKIIIAGHSEGSLIGMIAANKSGADAFISLAGAGFRADLILKQQIAAGSPIISETCNIIIDSLADGHIVQNVHPMLQSLFRPSVQPYLISWFKYDPQVWIRKLNIPVLIIQPTHDIQVSIDNGKALAQSLPAAVYKEIEEMNHILKASPKDRAANIATYNQPDLPLHVKLVKSVISFLYDL